MSLHCCPTPQLSVVVRLQSVSLPSHTSARPGRTAASESLQSPSHSEAPSLSTSVVVHGLHVSSTKPSQSSSTLLPRSFAAPHATVPAAFAQSSHAPGNTALLLLLQSTRAGSIP